MVQSEEEMLKEASGFPYLSILLQENIQTISQVRIFKVISEKYDYCKSLHSIHLHHFNYFTEVPN